MSIFARGDSEEEKVGRFVAGGVLTMLSFVVGGLTGGLLWVTAMTRWLGPEKFGMLGPIFFRFWLIAIVLSWGIPQSLITFISHHYEKDRVETIGFAREGSQLILWICLSLLGISIVILLLGLVHFLPLFQAALWFVLIAGVAVTLLFWVVNAVLNGLQRMDLVSVGQLIFPVGLFIGSSAGVFLFRAIFGKQSTMDVVGGALGMGTGGIIAFLFAYVLLKRCFPEFTPLFSVEKRTRTRKILTFGGFAAGCLTIQNVMCQLAPVLVGLFAQLRFYGTSPTQNWKLSGYFSAANLYGQGPLMLMGLTFALLPAISEAQRAGNRPLLQTYYQLATKISFSLIIPLTFLYIFMGGNIVQLFSGAEFQSRDIAPYIGMLGFGFGNLALIFMYIYIFMGLQDLKPAFLALVVGLITQTIGIIGTAFIFHHPIYAAAVMALSTFGVSLAMGLYIFQKHKLRIVFRDLWLPACSALSAILFVMMSHKFSLPQPLTVLLGSIGYILPGTLIGVITPEDTAFLRTLFAEKPISPLLRWLLNYGRGIRYWGQDTSL